MKWYGCFHCFSRGMEKTIRIDHEFGPEIEPKVVMEVLSNAAYFSLEPDKALEEFRESYPHEDPDPCEFFSFDLEEAGVNAFLAKSEEWNGAIAQSKEDLLEAYVKSEPETC